MDFQQKVKIITFLRRKGGEVKKIVDYISKDESAFFKLISLAETGSVLFYEYRNGYTHRTTW